MRLVGHIAGLGPTERIYAVRFMGPVAYVVTFRQTDPLYTPGPGRSRAAASPRRGRPDRLFGLPAPGV